MFVDVLSRRVVGWQRFTSLRTDLALNMGLWARAREGHDTSALVHHSDRGVQGGQYLAVRYTACSRPSSSATAVHWMSIDDLEIAVAEDIDWFGFRRLHGEIGLIPPVEHEALHRHTTPAQRPAERHFPVSTELGT